MAAEDVKVWPVENDRLSLYVRLPYRCFRAQEGLVIVSIWEAAAMLDWLKEQLPEAIRKFRDELQRSRVSTEIEIEKLDALLASMETQEPVAT